MRRRGVPAVPLLCGVVVSLRDNFGFLQPLPSLNAEELAAYTATASADGAGTGAGSSSVGGGGASAVGVTASHSQSLSLSLQTATALNDQVSHGQAHRPA